MICSIVAMAENGVIGSGGGIPWRIPGEQSYFKRVTMGHVIVMGRKTYESIGRPLPGRTNYVLTRDMDFDAEGCHVIREIETVLTIAHEEDVFIIGGAEVYNLFFPYTDVVYQTVVHQDIDGDTFFPKVDLDEWILIDSRPGPNTVLPHTFNVYRRKRS